ATDEQQAVAQCDGHGGADHGLQYRGIGCQARQHLARAYCLVITRGELDNVSVDGLANVSDYALADPGHQVEAAIGGKGKHGHDGEERHHGTIQPRDIASCEALVHEPAKTCSDHEKAASRDYQCNHGSGHLWLVGAHETPKVSQHTKITARRSIELLACGLGGRFLKTCHGYLCNWLHESAGRQGTADRM